MTRSGHLAHEDICNKLFPFIKTNLENGKTHACMDVSQGKNHLAMTCAPAKNDVLLGMRRAHRDHLWGGLSICNLNTHPDSEGKKRKT